MMFSQKGDANCAKLEPQASAMVARCFATKPGVKLAQQASLETYLVGLDINLIFFSVRQVIFNDLPYGGSFGDDVKKISMFVKLFLSQGVIWCWCGIGMTPTDSVCQFPLHDVTLSQSVSIPDSIRQKKQFVALFLLMQGLNWIEIMAIEFT